MGMDLVPPALLLVRFGIVLIFTSTKLRFLYFDIVRNNPMN